jgi:hypothetical protein
MIPQMTLGGTPMRRHAIAVIVALQAGVAAALAQPAQTGSPPPAASPAAAFPSSAPVAMEEPAPGDHWIYEIRDEVVGAVKFTRQSTITEVTPTEISTRFNVIGNGNSGPAIFDRSWNVTSRGGWRHSPNDGSGIKLPLAVGKSWGFKSNDVNSSNGASWSRSGTSKVVAQESVTTRAGTFDTFKIESSVTTRDVNNPSRMTQFANEVWYAPSIDHWVKRAFKITVDGHLMEHMSETLVAYGRKE